MRQTVRKFKEVMDLKRSLVNRLRSNRYVPYVFLALAFLLAACVHVWQRVHVLELVTDVSVLAKEQSGLEDDLKKVNSDIAALSMASRIEEYAKDTLGMIPVPPDRLYTLVSESDGGIQKDDLHAMLDAVKRVTDYVPRPSENSALAGEPSMIKIDSTERPEAAE
ncbi:MAG TPA: cell division protein FtsL [candidate division Zixibacteria bacterium]|nr:cell division protein FtsL [candidate division Zixibacteria bacterium]